MLQKQRRDGRRWGGEKGRCGGLYAKCPSQAMCLNTWSLACGAVRGRLWWSLAGVRYGEVMVVLSWRAVWGGYGGP